MQNWRYVPAQMVEEVIGQHCSEYPPSLEQLVEVAERYRFRVIYLDPVCLRSALTYHQKRTIFVPLVSLARMQEMLLHELAEALLRLPVAPEITFPVSDQDEFHEVAALVNLRARHRLH
jgi:hypothetical protein